MVKSNTNKLLLILMMFFFSFFGISCVNDNTTNNNQTSCYMFYIDPLSSITFDYENPNYGYASLATYKGYVYKFNSKKIYAIISGFNDVPLNNSLDYDEANEVIELFNRCEHYISIEVAYKYSISDVPSDDAIVHFYILSDGTLIFEDHRKISLRYSEPNAVDYAKIRTLIIKTGEKIK